MATLAGEQRGGDGDTRRVRRRRHAPALVIILVVGLAAVAVAFALASILEDENPRGPYLIGAWTFGDRASFAHAVDAGAIDEVSVDWLRSRADGSVEAPGMDADFIAEARRNDCRVFVTLTDYSTASHQFDPAIAAAILATPETRRRHVAAVADWCLANDVDGLDVDWEALTAGQRKDYTAFVKELARRLHEDGRLIAVDVYPKTGEPGGWDGPRAQDWRRLGETVDQFRVMTYNYSGSWSAPGPLSPPEWMDKVLDFAETQVEPRKIVMGVGFYGRDWRGAQTTDLVWTDVQRIRSADTPRESRGVSAEIVLSYSRDGAAHTAFFPDAKAIDAKLVMLLERHPRIRGVYCWIMGQEDPETWTVLRARLH
ncbi:MAG TPA: glycosyl hydrolase family 18 protein [Thermoleophilia bacterium]|nr:glycosyl hydrolase family 18 protein [Thermoleophilia bacterium]